MIIRGNIQTMQGPVPVESIKEGDLVIGMNHAPCEVMKVSKEEVTKVSFFALNPHPLISKGTRVKSVYGMKEAAGKLLLVATNGAEVPDTISDEEGTYTGYEIYAEGTEVLMVDDYGVEVGRC